MSKVDERGWDPGSPVLPLVRVSLLMPFVEDLDRRGIDADAVLLRQKRRCAAPGDRCQPSGRCARAGRGIPRQMNRQDRSESRGSLIPPTHTPVKVVSCAGLISTVLPLIRAVVSPYGLRSSFSRRAASG